MAHNHGATGHAAHSKHRQARCEQYKASGRREKNKVVKLKRHLAKHEDDSCAESALIKVKRAGVLQMEYSPA
jgi:hypothetical protein